MVVDVASFGAGSSVLWGVEDGSRGVPCASILKPFYAWVGEGRSRDKDAMICVSDNQATDRVVAATGGLGKVLDRIFARTGVAWSAAESWGQVRVHAWEVARAAEALMADRSTASSHVLSAMRAVGGDQVFGVPAVWAHHTHQHLSLVGAKSGWDLTPAIDAAPARVRTHLLVVGPESSRVVLTEAPVAVGVEAAWTHALGAGGPHAVLPVHDFVAGQVLRTAFR